MHTITDLLKKTLDTLTQPQRDAIGSLLAPKSTGQAAEKFSSLALSGKTTGPTSNTEYLILTLHGPEDAGQYLIAIGTGKNASPRLLHADTFLFPLPVEVDRDLDLAETPAKGPATTVADGVVQIELSKELAKNLIGPDDWAKLSDAEKWAHATALREGNTDLPLLLPDQQPFSGKQRGLVSWVKGLFHREDPPASAWAPTASSGSEQQLNDRLVAMAKSQVDIYSTVKGPDKGNLACVWAVDGIFTKAFGKRLTRSLGTAVIDEELAGGKGRLVKKESEVRPGNIVVSPTGTGKGHGHIGIVGRDGKIYSNSSSRARWEQNFTIESWKKRYVEDKKMALRFYQILPATAGIASRAAQENRSTSTTAPAAVTAATRDSTIAGESALAAIDRYWAGRNAQSPNVRAKGVPLVAEGDSWFDFRITRDVIDWLEHDYNYDISNVAQAGACVYEMAYGEDNDQLGDVFERDPSQLAEVVRLIREKRPRAVLLSGAGNDFVGPEFIMLLHHALAKPTGVNELVAQGLFENEIEPAFRRVIATIKDVAKREGLGDIPILVHGYDYAFPDNRPAANLLIKKIGPWMAPSFKLKGYPEDLEKRRGLVRDLIDRVYLMHGRIAREFSNIHIIDVRGTLPTQHDWHDELHPSREGFRKVAALFHRTLTQVLPRSAEPLSLTPASASSGRSHNLAAELAHDSGTATSAAPILHQAPEQIYPVYPSAAAIHFGNDESAASLLARATEAQHRENLLPWLAVDPLRVLQYQELLDLRPMDDTRGEDPAIAARALDSRQRIDDYVADALRWSSADIPGLRSQDHRAAPTLDQLRDEYRELYRTLHVRPAHASTVAWYLNRIGKGQNRYEALGKELNIPWQFIAITHSLEASNDFSKHLHNGDPLTARTTRVPANRPVDGQPPFTFEQSARDAMMMKSYHRQADWSVEAVLFRWENYNGWGYRSRAIHTPYLWSFSNHYTKGKFVNDHVYDENAVSRQVGTAVLLKSLGYTGTR